MNWQRFNEIRNKTQARLLSEEPLLGGGGGNEPTYTYTRATYERRIDPQKAERLTDAARFVSMRWIDEKLGWSESIYETRNGKRFSITKTTHVYYTG